MDDEKFFLKQEGGPHPARLKGSFSQGSVIIFWRALQSFHSFFMAFWATFGNWEPNVLKSWSVRDSILDILLLMWPKQTNFQFGKQQVLYLVFWTLEGPIWMTIKSVKQVFQVFLYFTKALHFLEELLQYGRWSPWPTLSDALLQNVRPYTELCAAQKGFFMRSRFCRC